MSSASVQLRVKGIDETGAAFTSVAQRAKATGASIRAALGGALTAAGAYLSIRSVTNAINELGSLSDFAAAANTSVADLSNGLTGLQVVGINTTMEQLSNSLAMMRKNTGREGMEGLYQTVEEIGKIPDAAERSRAAMAVFGRSGLSFMPLIDAADKGVAAVRGVADIMPRVPESAAKAGDEAKDAMKMAGDGFKSIWLQAVGKVVGWIGSFFPGGLRGAVATGLNYVEYGVKMAFISVQRAVYQIYNHTIGYLVKLGKGIGATLGTWFGGGGFTEGFKNFGKEWQEEGKKQEEAIKELDRLNNERAARWEKEFQDRKSKIDALGKGLGVAGPGNGNLVGKPSAEAGDTFGAAAAKRISNALIMGGSNQASRLAMLGPQYQNEAKKQTDILAKIYQKMDNIPQELKGPELAATNL